MAVAVLIYVNFHLREARGAFLLVYIMAMLFAVFRLSTRQMLAIVLPVIFAHGIFVIQIHASAPPAVVRSEGLHWVVLTVALLWFAHLGGYISDLRWRLRTLTIQDELTGRR